MTLINSAYERVSIQQCKWHVGGVVDEKNQVSQAYKYMQHTAVELPQSSEDDMIQYVASTGRRHKIWRQS